MMPRKTPPRSVLKHLIAESPVDLYDDHRNDLSEQKVVPGERALEHELQDGGKRIQHT
jgi:hypothetical protein